jgi:hypothetical protein
MDGVKHIQNIRKNGTPIIMRGERKPKVTKDSRNGLCGACLKPLGIETSNICVDHDHRTGKIRKILHQGCNIALARMNENVEDILNLAEYARYCNRTN